MSPLVSSVTSDTQSLDAHLVPRTYLVGNDLTAADVAVYGALQPIFVRTLRDCHLSANLT
jgi:glutathione S-transferase